MPLKKMWPFAAWILVTFCMSGYLSYRLFGPDRRAFLPGETTAGHYQIELNCTACHTPGMGVKEEACQDCHAAELKLANDSHPKSKFSDPRNADLLNVIRADNCVACHREHVPHQTRAMGVTMPADYCFHCHVQTLTDVPSHKGFTFDSCATAGCHNFHDNTALYKDFLLKHAEGPRTKDSAALPKRDLACLRESGLWTRTNALAVEQADAPKEVIASRKGREGRKGEKPEEPLRPLHPSREEPDLLQNWAATAHANAGVNCSDCHLIEDAVTRAKHWSDKLDHVACAGCHAEEVTGFVGGKHGMRLAQQLSPMTPAMARLPMKPEAGHRELNCTSCHGAHEFDTRRAAMDACLECHDDGHSRAYQSSKHFALWQNELNGDAPANSGVSCATCHLPREVHGASVRVQHNQNLNLRPNEKMIRSVCMNCHSLEFGIDALADAALVQTNFAGQPKRHVESIDLVLRRQAELRKKTTETKGNP